MSESEDSDICQDCPNCHGEGVIGPNILICPECEGSGEICDGNTV